MSVLSRRGREARTKWSVLRRFREFTLLELVIETGRTHQIRVHLAHLGHPVVGDALYGRKMARDDTRWIDRPALHSHVLGFRHPQTLDEMEFVAPLAEDIQAALWKVERVDSDPTPRMNPDPKGTPGESGGIPSGDQSRVAL
jgi:23S rRNA pseudouridine1911/1915/1917 synthase